MSGELHRRRRLSLSSSRCLSCIRHGLLGSRCWKYTTLAFSLIATLYLGSQALELISRLHWRDDLTWYDLGLYGLAPTTEYLSLEPAAPAIEFLRQDSRCSQEYIFLAPRGPVVDEPGGLILDAQGDLIWRQTLTRGDTQDLRVQQYYGENYLTFWMGEEHEGRKQGSWFMMDNTYTIQHEIRPGGDFLTGDMHEFTITRANTALITIYSPIELDLRPIGGPENGYILDSIVQEINITTGDILFQWSAHDHFPIDDTYWTRASCKQDPDSAFNGCGDHADSAFDFYHINSIEKDDLGNYLISGRNIHTISYVHGGSGEVIWSLGGRSNDFEDLSDGAATSFSWQHFARWLDFGRSISLFDNGGASHSDTVVESRGMIIDIDLEHRTVQLRASYYHPQQMKSLSQGDLQILEDTGNVFIGWGRSAAWTEFSPDGEVLCDARFGASLFFSFGTVTSYRTLRHSWVGKPATPPSVAVEDGSVYVSWNGATEVAKWQLEAVDGENLDKELRDEDFRIVLQAFKEGFETEIEIPMGECFAAIRLVALDANDGVLGVSDVLEYEMASALFTPMTIVIVGALAMVLGMVMTFSIGGLVFLRWRRSRTEQYGYELVDARDD